MPQNQSIQTGKHQIIIIICVAIILIGGIFAIITINTNSSNSGEHTRRLNMYCKEINYQLTLLDNNISYDVDIKEDDNTTSIIWVIGNNKYTINKYGEILANIGVNKKTNEITHFTGDNEEIKMLLEEKLKSNN